MLCTFPRVQTRERIAIKLRQFQIFLAMTKKDIELSEILIANWLYEINCICWIITLNILHKKFQMKRKHARKVTHDDIQTIQSITKSSQNYISYTKQIISNNASRSQQMINGMVTYIDFIHFD